MTDLLSLWREARGPEPEMEMSDLRAAFGASGTGHVPAAFTREVWKDGIDITEPSYNAERLWLAARASAVTEDALARFAEAVIAAHEKRCRYPACVENEDERCPRWLTGDCEGPKAQP